MLHILKNYFSPISDHLTSHLINFVNALIRCGRPNTYDMIRLLSSLNKKSFKTNEMALYRFLKDKKFQVNDSFWRCHINMIFDALKSNNLIKKDDLIQINVDYTTHEDHFLILSASVLLEDKAITIFFSSRLYPKKKGMMSCMKMEKAFIKGLKHLLSKQYRYLIVADRGFGNQRFANLCKENDFEYVLRIRENLIIERGGKNENLKNEIGNKKFKAKVISWQEEHNFSIEERNKERWYLMPSREDLDAKSIYEKRFKIEKNYQDCKSGGYEIEKNKIRKYDRFKRMMYLVILAHGISCIIGYIIKKTSTRIKKKLCEKEDLNTRLILAYSELDMKQYAYIIRNPLISLDDFSYHA